MTKHKKHNENGYVDGVTTTIQGLVQVVKQKKMVALLLASL